MKSYRYVTAIFGQGFRLAEVRISIFIYGFRPSKCRSLFLDFIILTAIISLDLFGRYETIIHILFRNLNLPVLAKVDVPVGISTEDLVRVSFLARSSVQGIGRTPQCVATRRGIPSLTPDQASSKNQLMKQRYIDLKGWNEFCITWNAKWNWDQIGIKWDCHGGRKGTSWCFSVDSFIRNCLEKRERLRNGRQNDRTYRRYTILCQHHNSDKVDWILKIGQEI